MHTTALSQNRPAWTWADLLSTYRFWGLFLLFVLTSAGMQNHFYLMHLLLRRFHSSLGIENTAGSFAQGASLCAAMILTWVAIRTKPVVVLLCTSGLAVLAAFAFAAGWPGGLIASVTMLTCVQMGSYVVTLLFPTLIAGALGGYETFVVAFGVAFLFERAVSLAMGFVTAGLSNLTGADAAGYVSAGLLLAAVICLIPVMHELFTVEPATRGSSIAPQRREAFLAGLLTAIIPFYMLYWVYKAHGEAAHLRPSRALLSPRGAAWIVAAIVLFPSLLASVTMRLMIAQSSAQGTDVIGILAVPLMALVIYSILLTTLTDQLNLCAADLGLPRVCPPWAVFLLTMLVSPVAVGILQAGLNKLAERAAQATPVPAA